MPHPLLGIMQQPSGSDKVYSRKGVTMQELTKIYKEETVGKKWNRPTVNHNTMNYNTEYGEVTRYNVYAPMTKEEFRALPIQSRQTYVNVLQKKYGCTCADVARMLGVDNSHFSERFGVKMAKLNRMGTKQRKEWEEFLKQNKHETQQQAVQEQVKIAEAVEEPTPQQTPQELYLEKIADITHALHTIKAMCEASNNCLMCPCGINNGQCLFAQHYLPADWQITEPKINIVTVK